MGGASAESYTRDSRVATKEAAPATYMVAVVSLFPVPAIVR